MIADYTHAAALQERHDAGRFSDYDTREAWGNAQHLLREAVEADPCIADSPGALHDAADDALGMAALDEGCRLSTWDREVEITAREVGSPDQLLASVFGMGCAA